jgi:hypothetical protein
VPSLLLLDTALLLQDADQLLLDTDPLLQQLLLLLLHPVLVVAGTAYAAWLGTAMLLVVVHAALDHLQPPLAAEAAATAEPAGLRAALTAATA